MTPLLQIVVHPAYLLACVLAGVLGRHRRGGFVGFLLVAVLLTPLFALFILYFAAERPARPPGRD